MPGSATSSAKSSKNAPLLLALGVVLLLVSGGICCLGNVRWLLFAWERFQGLAIYDPALGGDPVLAGAWEATALSALLAAGPLVLGVLAIRRSRARRSPGGAPRER